MDAINLARIALKTALLEATDCEQMDYIFHCARYIYFNRHTIEFPNVYARKTSHYDYKVLRAFVIF